MYDLVIIGGGPAGLTAAIYAGRANLKTLLIEEKVEGGQMAATIEVANYPGIPKDGTGMSLAMRMSEQAKSFNVEFHYGQVEEVQLQGRVKKVITPSETIEAKTVILSMGAEPRKLGVPGEEAFLGRGVSYCATCDGAFYQGGDIYIIGGGNAAVEEGDFLTNFADKVTLIHRRDELRADKFAQERAFANPKMDFIWDSEIVSIHGDNMAREMTIRNKKTGEETSFKQEEGRPFGVFFYIGFNPRTEIVKDQIELENGYIITDEGMQTSLEGVYAAGDIRSKEVRQVVTATADGAIAALKAVGYVGHLDS